MIAKAGDVRLVSEMVARFPELRVAYDRHLTSVGELLPHVLMWEFADLVIAAHQGHGTLDWRGVLDFVEGRLAVADPRTDGLIRTAFLENMPPRELGPLSTLLLSEIRPAL